MFVYLFFNLFYYNIHALTWEYFRYNQMEISRCCCNEMLRGIFLSVLVFIISVSLCVIMMMNGDNEVSFA